MYPITLSKYLSFLKVELEGYTICIYHKSYANKIPHIDDCGFIEFDKLCETYQTKNYFKNCSNVVFIGANKFFNSSTRFHGVFDILQYGLSDKNRYSIDIAPYIGEIWRVWTPFSFAGVPFGEYTYSYLLESHYNAYLEGVREDNPLSFDLINEYSKGNVYIDYDKYFVDPVIKVIELDQGIHQKYQDLKASLFNKHNTIGPIIGGLTKFARDNCDERVVPTASKLFDNPDEIKITRTDLKIDEYLTGKILNKITEVNKVVDIYND